MERITLGIAEGAACTIHFNLVRADTAGIEDHVLVLRTALF